MPFTIENGPLAGTHNIADHPMKGLPDFWQSLLFSGFLNIPVR